MTGKTLFENSLQSVNSDTERFFKTIQFKRAGSKLSSRHSRRKRRERENKELSAKTPRDKRSKSEVPIPSFTPITEEHHHEIDAATDNGCACQSDISMKSQQADEFLNVSCNSMRQTHVIQNKGTIGTKCGVSSAHLYTQKQHAMNSKSSDQDLDAQQFDKSGSGHIGDSDLVHSEKQSISSEVPKAPQERSTTKYSTAKETSQTVNELSSKKKASNYEPTNRSISSTIQSPCAHHKEENRMEKNLSRGKSKEMEIRGTFCNVRKSTSMSQHHEASNDNIEIPGMHCAKEMESDSVVEILPFKKARTTLVMSSSSSLVQKNEGKKLLKSGMGDGSEIVNAKANTGKGSRHLGSSNIVEVINILDDDLGGNTALTKGAGERGAKKKVTLGKKAKAKRKNQRGNKRKIKISRSSSDSSSLGEEFVPCTKIAGEINQSISQKKKGNVHSVRPEAPSNRKRCFACSTCKCNSRSGISTTPQKFPSLSGSSARQEQSLLNRLQRIERDIAWKEGQRNDVARELRKCRGQMLKKWDTQSLKAKTQRPRFLSDAEVSEDLGKFDLQVNSEEINRACKMIFGRPKRLQQTLTQIISAPKGDNDDIESKDKSNGGYYDGDLAKTTNISEVQHGTESSQDNFLSFWEDSEPIEDSSNCLGSMNFFKNAVARLKDMKHTGRWAKATANTLRMEEEEGFDELVELFDASLHKSDSHNSFVRCDTNVDDRESCWISPKHRHRKVVKEIESSVKNDHERMAAIERMCPNWKENIEFAQAQTDPTDLHIALQNVQQANEDLESMKKRILQAFLDRKQTLDLYEKSLQVAFDHLTELDARHRSVTYIKD